MNQDQIELLIAEAAAVRERAHAPYSGYKVGAALLGTDGRVYVGCNVENASYGLSVCAERNAVASAVAAGCLGFHGAAVVTPSVPSAAPCGACRQVLAEFGDFPVVLAGLDGDQRLTTVLGLLPVFGLATAFLARREYLLVRSGGRGNWNPARRYWIWGGILAYSALGLNLAAAMGVLAALLFRFHFG